jgi:hypothetical protein
MAQRSLGVRLADYMQKTMTGALGELAAGFWRRVLTARWTAVTTVYLAYKGKCCQGARVSSSRL